MPKRFCLENVKRRDRLEGTSRKREISINIYIKQVGCKRCGLEHSGPGQGSLEGSYEFGNAFSVSVMGMEYLD